MSNKEIIEEYKYGLEMAETELEKAQTNIDRAYWNEQVRWYEVKISQLKSGYSDY